MHRARHHRRLVSCGRVSIGVAFDLAGQRSRLEPASSRPPRCAGASSRSFRCVGVLQSMRSSRRTSCCSPAETGYGLLAAAVHRALGAVTLATVVAAIEPAPSRLRLPLIALGKALAVSAQFVNLGRLMRALGAADVPAVCRTAARRRTCARTTWPNVDFWSDIPIDMLTLGPLQAIATVFYVDFLRRAGRGKIH